MHDDAGLNSRVGDARSRDSLREMRRMILQRYYLRDIQFSRLRNIQSFDRLYHSL